MPEPKIGFRHGSHFTGRHLEELQRGLTSSSKAASVAQEDDPLDVTGNEGAQTVRPFGKQSLTRMAETVGPRHKLIASVQPAQKSSAQSQVGETAGHHETAVIDLIAQRDDPNPRVRGKFQSQPPRWIAGDDQVASVGLRLEQRFHHCRALRAVAGAGQ